MSNLPTPDVKLFCRLRNERSERVRVLSVVLAN